MGKRSRTRRLRRLKVHPEPSVVARDPRTKVHVAIEGHDRGTKECWQHSSYSEVKSSDLLPDDRSNAVLRRARDTLDNMHDQGVIDGRLYDAGRWFAATFYRARLEPLKAQDLSRDRVDGAMQAGLGAAIEGARQDIADCVKNFGGIGSLSASIVWCVCGEQLTVERWAELHPRAPNRRASSGVLIGALDALAAWLDARRLDRVTPQAHESRTVENDARPVR